MAHQSGMACRGVASHGRTNRAGTVVNETVRDGENGLLAPPNDPAGLAATIVRLLDDPALRARLVAGSQHTLTERFDGNVLTEQTLTLYREAITAKKRKNSARTWQGDNAGKGASDTARPPDDASVQGRVWTLGGPRDGPRERQE